MEGRKESVSGLRLKPKKLLRPESSRKPPDPVFTWFKMWFVSFQLDPSPNDNVLPRHTSKLLTEGNIHGRGQQLMGDFFFNSAITTAFLSSGILLLRWFLL